MARFAKKSALVSAVAPLASAAPALAAKAHYTGSGWACSPPTFLPPDGNKGHEKLTNRASSGERICAKRPKCSRTYVELSFEFWQVKSVSLPRGRITTRATLPRVGDLPTRGFVCSGSLPQNREPTS